MASSIEVWLEEATRGLAADSRERVAAEVRDHYESAIAAGGTAAEALADLGDAAAANREYRRALLTAADARMLRESASEARAVCGSARVRNGLLVAHVTLLLASAAWFQRGDARTGALILLASFGSGLVFLAPFLPIFTPGRARAFRAAKWALFGVILALAFGEKALGWSWLICSCLWPMVWIEMRRASVRRKLKPADWPKHLYF